MKYDGVRNYTVVFVVKTYAFLKGYSQSPIANYKITLHFLQTKKIPAHL